MGKLESQTSKEATWRSRLQRHAQSGKSIAAFCREEAVSTVSFHIWRAKLAAADGHAAQPAQPAAFIDLGAIKNTGGVTSLAHAPASASIPTPGVDVRIDLGVGIVLTITRRWCSSLKAGYACSCTGSRSICVCPSTVSTRWRNTSCTRIRCLETCSRSSTAARPRSASCTSTAAVCA